MFRKILTLVKEAAIYGSGTVLSQLVTFLLLPLLTRQLSPTDYGIIGMLAVVPLVLVVLATSGIKAAVYQRFNLGSEAERATMLSTSMVGTTLSALSFLGVALLATPLLARFLFGAQTHLTEVALTSVTAFLGALAEIPRAGLQSFRRAKAVTALNLAQLVTGSFTTLGLVVFLDQGVRGVVLGALAGQIVSTVGSVWLLRGSWSRNLSMEVWRSMRAYGRPYLPHRLVGVVMGFYGDYVVREKLGLHETGLFSMATRFASPIALMTNALQQAWQPYKFKIRSEDPDPPSFFASAFTYFVAVFAYLLVGLSAWGPELLRLMTAPEFHAAGSLVWAIALMRVVQGTYPLLATGVDVGDNTRRVPIASLVSLIVLVPATMLLVPRLGAMGAALGSMLSWLAMCVSFYFISQRVYPIPYDWKSIAIICGLAAAAIGISVGAQSSTTPWRLGVSTLLSLAFPALVWGVLGRSSAERERMGLLLIAVRRRFKRAPAGI
jgi:O-antigen/teichoic acid export membrane protein